jgi:hypothetical protein
MTIAFYVLLLSEGWRLFPMLADTRRGQGGAPLCLSGKQLGVCRDNTHYSMSRKIIAILLIARFARLGSRWLCSGRVVVTAVRIQRSRITQQADHE